MHDAPEEDRSFFCQQEFASLHTFFSLKIRFSYSLFYESLLNCKKKDIYVS